MIEKMTQDYEIKHNNEEDGMLAQFYVPESQVVVSGFKVVK